MSWFSELFSFMGKYILYVFNILCLVSSFCIIAIAIIINQTFFKWSNLINTELLTAPQILLVIGLGVLVIASIGLCGVLRDNGCYLTLFSVLLTIVLIGELVLAGIIYHVRGDIEKYAMDQMNYTMSNYNKTTQATTTWNILQTDFKCCGISGPQDWKRVTHSDELPEHCCHAIPVGGFCTIADSYPDGCFVKLEKSLQENSQLIIWSAIGFALVQLLAVFLACCRKCSIREEYETV